MAIGRAMARACLQGVPAMASVASHDHTFPARLSHLCSEHVRAFTRSCRAGSRMRSLWRPNLSAARPTGHLTTP